MGDENRKKEKIIYKRVNKYGKVKIEGDKI